MNKILETYLVKKYPKIFRDMYGDPRQTCMAWGCACGDGWFHVLDCLCFAIQDHIDQRTESIKKKYSAEGDKEIPQVIAHQIKEKFGTLRFYYEGGDEYIRGLIRMAECMTYRLCENCGKTEGVGVTKGWIQHLCPECSAEYNKPIVSSNPDITKVWKQVIKSRKNPKRAWKGQDEPFTKEDFIPPYVKNKKPAKKKGKK